MTEQMILYPVGFVRNEIKAPVFKSGENELSWEERLQKIKQQQKKLKTLTSELVVEDTFSGLLKGIDGFSHLLVLYWPHLNKPERRKLDQVRPMGCPDIPKQGIFATCSPARPNPVLITAVQLLEHYGNTLRVRGLDAVNGSPIIDIKPYASNYYRIDHPTVPGWMEWIQEELKP